MNKYFLGTYEPKLLAGGQLALPAKIRRVLNDDNLILSTGFDKCIFGFSPEGWEKIIQAGFDRPVFTADGRIIRRQIFSAAEEVEMDPQGRFSVPANLREFADLSQDIVVIGAGDHFEIWNKANWTQMRDKLKETVS